MDTFITVFNANRHWILPMVLAVVAGLLLRELRNFFLESGPDILRPQLREVRKDKESLTGFPLSARGILTPMPKKRFRPGLQLGSAVLFQNSRYNSMK
ncbi:MAG: hypothetical protein JEZ02_16310 [Desulfatibacillum sp.]|nr:hypothetical protein [Desulfatibacillum sp.]